MDGYFRRSRMMVRIFRMHVSIRKTTFTHVGIFIEMSHPFIRKMRSSNCLGVIHRLP